jgi:hypothetical protein
MKERGTHDGSSLNTPAPLSTASWTVALFSITESPNPDFADYENEF